MKTTVKIYKGKKLEQGEPPPVIEPADPKRCQADIKAYNAFVMGGSTTTTERCKNFPVVIAREKKPGPDGAIGEMSMCASCKAVFEQAGGAAHVNYEHLA